MPVPTCSWRRLVRGRSGPTPTIWLIIFGGSRPSRFAEETVTIEDLRRYLALCGAEHAGPLGVPWRERPLSEAALAVRATCLKGYYLDLTMREDVNPSLRAELSARRLANHRDRDRSALGHLVTSVASNPLTRGAPPRRHPRLLPDGARDADARRGPDGA